MGDHSGFSFACPEWPHAAFFRAAALTEVLARARLPKPPRENGKIPMSFNAIASV
ncbi:hypothetical protein [Agrobacterium tumefaciens]|uniref:hypothetical protein n=1 Tax=Agrobacterium tumefaciens TaxID=358 RepID=UPI001571C474|nr:hypothetical protein [Agrobacterium tumefaciens]NSX93385.1 hypothetical protein [Agrobacterium tumefaciens]